MFIIHIMFIMFIQLGQSKKLTQRRLDSKEIKEILYIGSFPTSIL